MGSARIFPQPQKFDPCLAGCGLLVGWGSKKSFSLFPWIHLRNKGGREKLTWKLVTRGMHILKKRNENCPWAFFVCCWLPLKIPMAIGYKSWNAKKLIWIVIISSDGSVNVWRGCNYSIRHLTSGLFQREKEKAISYSALPPADFTKRKVAWPQHAIEKICFNFSVARKETFARQFFKLCPQRVTEQKLQLATSAKEVCSGE